MLLVVPQKPVLAGFGTPVRASNRVFDIEQTVAIFLLH